MHADMMMKTMMGNRKVWETENQTKKLVDNFLSLGESAESPISLYHCVLYITCFHSPQFSLGVYAWLSQNCQTSTLGLAFVHNVRHRYRYFIVPLPLPHVLSQISFNTTKQPHVFMDVICCGWNYKC